MGGIIENRHTGIFTMRDQMKKANLPEPIFENKREDFFVTFKNGKLDKRTQDKRTQDKRTQDKKNKNIEIILDFCEEPKSLNEIMEKLGYKSNRIFRRNYINLLLEQKLLLQTIPDKPRSKYQKYVKNKNERGEEL